MQRQHRDAFDVAIVGAGPAGLAAAAITAAAGLATAVIDENAGPGGQIYRAIETTPVTDQHILGIDYWRGLALVEAAVSAGAEFLNATTVWNLDRDLNLGISSAGGARMIRARRVIVATGAQERPFPIPGWTLPGVMTVGAAQSLLKSSGLVPDGRIVLAGTGPLLWLYAAQVLRAGGEIYAILDTAPKSAYGRALRHAASFVVSPLLVKGLRLMKEVMPRVNNVRWVTRLAAEGSAKVESVTFGTAGGSPQRLAVDYLLLHQGVVPNVNLAMAAGIAHAWNPLQLCWSPVLDENGNTSVPGVAIAGDGGVIAGAWVAEDRGRLAGLDAVRSLQPGATTIDQQEAQQSLRRHLAGRSFLDTLYQPPQQFRVPHGDTIVCRCEEVTARQIRDTAALGCEGPNQMKAFLRCGMGPCQGRLCGLTVTELIAEARGVHPGEVGYYRLRSPVKPITLAELARMPADAPAVNAVVRP